MRERLKAEGYKAGRISQLLKATRPATTEATLEMAIADLHERDRPAQNGEAVAGLPRLYQKQVPRGGWEAVQSPPWVQRRLAEPKACRSNAARSRAKKSCAGFSALVGCLFSTQDIGQPAKPMAGAKCVFCDVDKMVAACDSIGGRKSITRSLKAFRADYQRHSHVYNAALMRVPEEWREKFHAEALKEKRGQPKEKRPRKAEVSVQGQATAEAWKAVLVDRKRAFSSLGSKAVTAYKKRRKADRNRVEKKFFLDNDLPPPQPEDIADNDAGLPRAATSTRAAFVEQWCKFGSFAICKQCRSLQPRPLEPIDTRRVAPAEMTAKACKQCRAGQWVPQPEDIPRPLKKLSVELSKVLRPLDIHVGPEKKAANGYRHHATRAGASSRCRRRFPRQGPKIFLLFQYMEDSEETST